MRQQPSQGVGSVKGDSESRAPAPSQTAEAAPVSGSDADRAIRLDCLSLAQEMAIQFGNGEGKEVLELARQYADFVLRGTPPAPAQAIGNLDAQAGRTQPTSSALVMRLRFVIGRVLKRFTAPATDRMNDALFSSSSFPVGLVLIVSRAEVRAPEQLLYSRQMQDVRRQPGSQEIVHRFLERLSRSLNWLGSGEVFPKQVVVFHQHYGEPQ